MKTSSKFERLYYGMAVYSISDSEGHTAELRAGIDPDSEADLRRELERELADGQRAVVEARILDLAIEAKVAEIDAYDTSEAVNGFILDGAMAWLDRDTRGGLDRRLAVEEAGGRETTTLWLGTRSFTLPISLAKALLGRIELYAADCFDVTARHKAAVMALTTPDDVRTYDHTAGYPERPVIATQV